MDRLKVAAVSGSFAAALLGSTISHATAIGAAHLTGFVAENAVPGSSHGVADATFPAPARSNPACEGAFTDDTRHIYSAISHSSGLRNFLVGEDAAGPPATSRALPNTLDAVLEFIRTITAANSGAFQAGHDHRLQIMIGSDLFIDAPSPTSFATTPATYTGPSGTSTYDRVYLEYCDELAALVKTPRAVTSAGGKGGDTTPKPLTLVLAGVGLLSLASAIHRKVWLSRLLLLPIKRRLHIPVVWLFTTATASIDRARKSFRAIRREM